MSYLLLVPGSLTAAKYGDMRSADSLSGSNKGYFNWVPDVVHLLAGSDTRLARGAAAEV